MKISMLQLSYGNYVLLDDYIKLQQENEQLKEIEKEHQKINGELRKELKKKTSRCTERNHRIRCVKRKLEKCDKKIEKLQERINKTIKYINSKQYVDGIRIQDIPEKEELLNILKGDSDYE